MCHKKCAHHQDSWQQLCQLIKIVVYAAASILVAYSRVYLGYHDLPQVIAGATAGLSVAVICFAVTCCAARYFPAWQQLKIAKLFRIKDTWTINDVLLFEYVNTLSQKPKKDQ